MIGGRDNIDRWRFDLNRVTDAPQPHEPIMYLLAVITGSTLISGSTKRYTYTWAEATFAVTTPSTKSGGLTGSAISVSELSNDATNKYSYGVDPTNLPGTFDAVAIPTGTYVFIVPYRGSDGDLQWLIVNTQAIDGTCE